MYSTNDRVLIQRILGLVPSGAESGSPILKINCVQSQLLSPEKKLNKVSKKFNRKISDGKRRKVSVKKV